MPGLGDLDSSQEVGVDLVAGSRLGEPALGGDRRDAHAAHEAGHVLAADGEAAGQQLAPDPSCAEKRQLGAPSKSWRFHWCCCAGGASDTSRSPLQALYLGLCSAGWRL